MKHLVIFGNEFEDVEAIATLDVLLRGKEEVVAVSMNDNLEVNSKCGFKVQVNALLKEIKLEEFDSLIIPGGPGSFKYLAYDERLKKIIEYFVSNDKLVSAICAAPMILGKYGYLKDLNYTLHPGFEDQVIGGHYLKDNGVVVTPKIITAKAMYYSIEFGLAIYEHFHGKEARIKLEKSCQGN